MDFHQIGSYCALPSRYSRSLSLSMLIIIVAILSSGKVDANDTPFNPLVIFQGETKSGSYLQIIDSGIARFEQKTGTEVARIHLKAESDNYVNELRNAAQSGYSPIIVHDSNNIESFPALAKQFPSVQFISLDVAYHVPNILGLTFNHAEGAYIIGYLAGLKTQSNTIGFIGGLDIPVINDFRCGFELGAKDSNPTAEFDVQYINNGAFSWDDLDTAKAITQNMLENGIDVIFPVAGYASLGAMQSVKEHGHSFSFGVDNDFSDTFPHTSIASLEKRVDLAIFAALTQLHNGIWNGTQKHFGIKQGVISVTLNNHNTQLSDAEKQIAQQLILDLKGKSSPISQRIDQNCSETR